MNTQDINTSATTAAQTAAAEAHNAHRPLIDEAAQVASAAAGAAAYASTQQVLKEALPVFDLGNFQAEDFTPVIQGGSSEELAAALNRHSQVMAAHSKRLADMEADRKSGAFNLSDYITLENTAIAAGVVVGGTVLVLGTAAVAHAVINLFSDDVAVTA